MFHGIIKKDFLYFFGVTILYNKALKATFQHGFCNNRKLVQNFLHTNLTDY